jgi:WD40 repeat protein/serine/threonine protein kinase
MGKRPIFGMDPEQMDRLLSIGTDEGDSVSVPIKDANNGNGAGSDKNLDKPVPAASIDVFIEQPGNWIGRYRLSSVLGEGGMGVVYLAQQEHPIKRQVALKVIKPGMDSKRIIARFEAERQALALLEHPNIAHVYDAGTTEKGRPYFVMELVRGVPITEYCDRHKLGIEERLGLFLQLCYALQHAHQKGIIHRDIKPSNILVTIQENHPVPKIIDFGVAKAAGRTLTERTLYTGQDWIVGTPEFMSPEQADMIHEDIDIRSDIYSLGVLLYVLLTGVLPFDSKTLRKGGIDNLRRIICRQDPKTPSTRLSSLGEKAKKLAQMRHTEIRDLTKRLQKELEWIPLKAMRKEPARRYRSASELADDIQNYLEGRPLIAGPESSAYRIKKLIQKNRGKVAAALAILTILLLGIVVSTAMFFNADKQRLRAESQLAISEIEDGVRLLNEGNRLGLLDLLQARTTADRIPDLRKSAARLRAIAYDMWSDHLIHVMPEGQDLAISPDGRLLAIATGEAVQLWDMATGRPQDAPFELGETVSATLFSPDGTLLAASSKVGVARLWNPLTGKAVGPLLQLEGTKCEYSSYKEKRSAAFSSDGKLLATAMSNGTVLVWETDSGDLHGRPIYHDSEVLTVDFSPDGKLLATGIRKTTAHLWTVATGQAHCPPLQHQGWVEKVTFSPDGKLLATAGSNGTTCLWDTNTGRLHKQLTTHDWMMDLTFSPDGKLLAGASFDWTVRLWNTATGETYGPELPHSARVMEVKFNQDGTLIASASVDGVARLWEVATQQLYCEPLHQVGSMVFSPDGKLLVTTGYGTTRIWKIQKNLHTQIVPQLNDVGTGYISANGRVRVTFSGDMAQFKDAATGETLGKEIHVGGNRITAALNPEGNLLAVSYTWWKVKLWDVRSGQESKVFGCYERIYALAFSPDGKVLATGVNNGQVILWDVATGEHLDPPLPHQAPLQAVAFGPNGGILATASAKRGQNTVIRLWDISAGPPYHSLLLTLNQAVRGKAALGRFNSDGMICIEKFENGNSRMWLLPAVKTDLHQMRLLTWVALALKRNNNGEVSAIPWEQHHKLRQELRLLHDKAE